MMNFEKWNGKPVAEILPQDPRGEGVKVIRAEDVGGLTFHADYRGDHSVDYIREGDSGRCWNVLTLEFWTIKEGSES